MGNSNSLHNLNMHDDQYPPSWVQSMPRDMYHHHRQSSNGGGAGMHQQVKVLPDLNGGARLRPTNNGQILQAGGTISVKNPGLQRSRSVSAPHHYAQNQPMTSFEPQFLKSRSQTQINIIPRESPTRDLGGHGKRFGSETDIREKLAAERARGKQPHLKKRKAPEVPVQTKILPESSTDSRPASGPRNDGVNRKLRLFKTKAEAKKDAGRIPADIPRPSYFAKNPEIQAQKTSPPKVLAKTPAPDWKKMPKISNISLFRREKSFDLSLMNREREEVAQKKASSPPIQRKNIKMEDRKLPKIPTPPKPERTLEKKDSKAPVMKSYVRKQIQPIPVQKDDFQQELLQATKRRSLALADEPKKEAEKVTKIVQEEKRSPSKSPDKIIINVKEFSQMSESNSSKQEAMSAVPKTFYFGEGEHEAIDDEVEREQMELIDRFAESFLIQRKFAASSESALSSDTEDNLELRVSQEREKQEISLRLRPVLPRKQFEIPRFSPAAAWRLLSEDDCSKREDTLDWVNSVEKITETRESEKSEERIERIYREPGPGIHTDNKSGDSGISGDAGLVERPESPRTTQRKTDTGYVGTWTPQQDLDSSTDDETEDTIKRHLNLSYQNKQVFNLTLPRDVHTPTYSEKSEKNHFNSMQKLKKERDFDTSSPIIADDNWFLSRSTSIPPTATTTPVHHIEVRHSTPIQNTYRDDYTPGSGGGGGGGGSLSTYREDEIKPLPNHETISYLTSGKHKVYLPNREGCSLPAIPHIEDEIKVTKLLRNLPTKRECTPPKEAQDDEPLMNSPIKFSKSKKFTYQSTVRQVERRRLAEKLSREAEEMEAHRISELEVMRRVEEEFQKKRAREKASIRHQLQLFSNEDSPHAYSLPVEWNLDTRRSDPEGASPQPGNSPTGTRGATKKDYSKMQREDSYDSFVDTKTPYINKIVEQKSGKMVAPSSGKSLVEILPYQQRSSFGVGSNNVDKQQQQQHQQHHHLSSSYQNSFNVTPSGNQFIRTSYDDSERAALSSLYQSIDSAYDKVFQ